MKRRKSTFQSVRVNLCLVGLFIVFYFCAKVSGTEVVQVKIKETANFTWKFEHYSQISLKYILKDKQETLAAKTPGEKADINPRISEDFKNRISFNVDDKKKAVTFLLKDVTDKDDGKTFELEIETKTKIIKASKKLTIVEQPRFTSSVSKLKEENEGKRMEIRCSASGKPTPSIIWLNSKTGAILTTALGSQSLTFEAINRTDGGKYTCKASNIAGEIMVTTDIIVNYLPEIVTAKTPSIVYSYLGNPSPVVMKCFANGHPKPTYQWRNIQNEIVSNSETLRMVNPGVSEFDVSYRCFASNKVGTSNPYSVLFKRLEKPGKVSASIKNKDATSISIEWILPTDKGGGELISVIIMMTHPAGSKTTSTFPITSTNTTFQNLKPYSRYTFEIRVKNQLLDGSSFLLNAQTSEAAPSVPTNFRQASLDASLERQIKVLWSPPIHKNGVIRKYEIAYGSRDALSPKFDVATADKKVLDKNAVSATLKDLKPFQEYVIQLRAVTVAPGPWTEPVIARTANEAPSAPRNVSVEILGAHMIRVIWKNPELIYGPISTLEANLGWMVNGEWLSRNELFIENPEQRTRIIGNSVKLKAFTTHKIEIREAAGRKWGPFSSSVFFDTPEGVPSVPKDMKVTHRTSNTLSLSWQMPSLINGILKHFIVFYENSTKQYNVKIDKDLSNHTFRHRIVNLKVSTKYTLMVQAFTSAGGGARTVPLETSTIAAYVAQPRSQPDDEISAGPIIGGIFSFLVILVLLIILILFIARKQRLQKKAASILDNQPFDTITSPEARLLTPANDEPVPDVVTTNGNVRMSHENHVEENLASQRCFISSRPIKLSELKEVSDRLHVNKDAGFVQEFKSIRRDTEVTWEISDRAENKCKNRYANIVAYDHSRVILSYIENIPGSDYINANFIDGYNMKKKFIATQGPVAASFGDFWRMVWEQNAHVIVMVTNLIEKSRIKCQKYWPTGDAQQYGSLTVTPEEEIELADYVIRQFSVVMSTGKEKHLARKVTQFQFTGWPDHGVPQYATALLHFVQRVRSTAQDHDSAPLICHCSAGVGRTGTYITLDTMLDQIKSESAVDVHGCLTHMRGQRNYMVQTEYQYAFIYDALLESVICGDTEIYVKDLSARIKELELLNQETNKTYLEEEFNRLSYNLEENHIYEAGLFPINANKNRFSTVLPIEATRLKLWPYPNVEGSDYINANFVDGYQQREAFILTQAPLENTVEDFWRMIWEYEVYSIVMLTSPEESDSHHCYPYWPTNEEPAPVGLLLVQIAAEEERSGYVKREFRVTNSKTGESRVVTHFMFYDWPLHASPTDASLVIDMIAQLQRTQQMTGNASIAVHCSDGCGRSGSLCSIMFCIERLKLEGVVDVFQTVRLMRTQRPQIIGELDHYLFCYNAVKKFVDKFSDYANFK